MNDDCELYMHSGRYYNYSLFVVIFVIVVVVVNVDVVSFGGTSQQAIHRLFRAAGDRFLERFSFRIFSPSLSPSNCASGTTTKSISKSTIHTLTDLSFNIYSYFKA